MLGSPVVSTDTSEGCAYRVRIKFLIRIILASHTYSSNWACRRNPLKRLSSSADPARLPESDTGPFHLAFDEPMKAGGDLIKVQQHQDLLMLKESPQPSCNKSMKAWRFLQLIAAVGAGSD